MDTDGGTHAADDVIPTIERGETLMEDDVADDLVRLPKVR